MKIFPIQTLLILLQMCTRACMYTYKIVGTNKTYYVVHVCIPTTIPVDSYFSTIQYSYHLLSQRTVVRVGYQKGTFYAFMCSQNHFPDS